MPVSVAARRPSAPSSPSSSPSARSYTSSYSTTSRFTSLSRSSVTSLDLTSNRYLSDRLASSSLSSRPIRHGSSSHSDDVHSVLSRFSTSRERSTEPRSSTDSSSTRSREREGSVTKTRLGSLGLDSTSVGSALGSTTSSRLGSAYTGASSTKLGRPPVHSTLSTTTADDLTSARLEARRSRTTPSLSSSASTASTMTTSTGKPFHSRFLKPKIVPSEETGEKTTPSGDKELTRDEDDARNNNSNILNNNSNGTSTTDNRGEDGDDDVDDDNGNENHQRRPSVALLRQRFDLPSATSAVNGLPSGTSAAPTPTADGKHQDGATSTSSGTSSLSSNSQGGAPLVGGHEDTGRQQQRLSASPGPANSNSAHSDSDNYDSPHLNRRAPSTAIGTRGSGLNGLRNIGNTCFMNSVIQCLSNTRPLLEYLLKQTYLSEINTTNSSMKGALIKAFAKMIEELWSGEGQVINTSAFKGQIQHFAPRFMGYSQQDAQEFLRYLLEGLHEDVNRVEHRPTNIILPDIDDSLNDNQKADESWRRYLRIDNSYVVDVCVGQLKSTLQCTVCGHCSVTFDPFWDLSLPIPSRTGQVRLHQCLEHFTKEEVLDGDEKPTCAKCQTRRKCTKRFSIQKFPKILVLHLKRFSPMERFRGKLNVTVEFPMTNLDLSPYAANRGRGCTYNLYGIANHSGTTYSGHYTAYCKHPYTHEWHEYNDSRVSSISSRSLVSGEAYVLFYELSGHTSHL